jgi:hypothetical protein
MAPGLLQNDDSVVCTSLFPEAFSTATGATSPVAKLDFEAFADKSELVVEITKSLKTSGGCIVRGMYQRQTLHALEREIRPHLEATMKADQKRDDFVPSTTRMVTVLLSKSRTYALSVVGNSLWHCICEQFLTSRLTNSWVSPCLHMP